MENLILPKDYQYNKDNKNLRTIINGAINSKKANPTVLNSAHFIAYSIPNSHLSPENQFNMLQDMNFEVPTHDKIIFLNHNFSKILVKWRENSRYEIDGLVLSKNIFEPITEGKNPKLSKAFKTVLQDQIASSKVIDIEWNTTKDNLLKPVIVIEPVKIGGTTIQRVSGYNASNLVKTKIGVGSKVKIIKSGDVIPKIQEVITFGSIKWPLYNWEWDKDRQVDICLVDKDINKDKLLLHFVNTLSIKFISISLCI